MCAIHWTSCGGHPPIAAGTGFYIAPNQATAAGPEPPAVVVLYHLATWHWGPAYTKYNWYSPQGRSYDGVTGSSA